MAASASFPEPLSPPAPQLIQHGHGHDGEIHLKLSPLSNNPSGPVSSYRVVVMNESDRSPFDPESTGVWREGAAHWVAAEIDPAWFRLHDEFVVGDGRRYGKTCSQHSWQIKYVFLFL